MILKAVFLNVIFVYVLLHMTFILYMFKNCDGTACNVTFF